MGDSFSNEIRACIQERDFARADALCAAWEKCNRGKNETVLLYDLWSTVARGQNHLDRAEELLSRELELARECYDPYDTVLAGILHNLSMLLDLQQKYAEAIPYAEEELSILRNALPSTDPRIADCLLSLGKHHYELGRFALAREFIYDAMERYTKIHGRHSLGVSACLNNLGRILENEGENEQSVPLFKEATAIRRDLLGTHEETAFTLLNYGTALVGTGSYREAERIIQVLLECRDMYDALGLWESRYCVAARDNLLLCWNAVCTPC